MDGVQIIPDQQTAEKLIRERCADAQRITFINHGYHNVIAEVDERYIFRFPRHERSLGRFDFETTLLEKIGDNFSELQVPRVLEKSMYPAFVKLSYIPGEQLDNKEVRNLPEDVQKTIGEQLVSFIQDFNQTISVQEMQRLRADVRFGKGFEPWPTYLKRVFAKPQSNKNLQALINHYYRAWQAIDHNNKPQLVIHDDLHNGNLLFKDGRLTGVLDFEHATTGTIEQEFHYLYRQGGSVLQHAVSAYEQATGQRVEINDIKIWAIIGELAAFTRRLGEGDIEHKSFLRARAKLRHWLPDFPL